VRVRSSGSWAVVEVSDEGSGVAPEVEPRVFERSVSGGDSSGLGLALARTLVAADGGRLELLSARPAVFAMFLPTHLGHEAVLGEPSPRDAVAEPERIAPPVTGAQATVEMAASSAESASSGNTQRR
jgi:hypothetical protein